MKRFLAMKNKDYSVFVERENWGESMYTIEDMDGHELYHTESYRDAVQTCTYLQTKLDNARWLAVELCLKLQRLTDEM